MMSMHREIELENVSFNLNDDRNSFESIPSLTNDPIEYVDTSNFCKLGGAKEQLLVSHIFSFLSAADLLSIGKCSHFWLTLSSTPVLWNSLIKNDFLILGHASTFRLPSSRKQYFGTKADYARYLEDSKNHQRDGKSDSENFNRIVESHSRHNFIERFVDISLLRLLLTLPVLSIFVSLLLIGLHFDGYGIPIWACAAPILFVFFYLFLCILITVIVYKSRYSRGDMNGLWAQLDSPIKEFYVDFICDSKIRTAFTIVIICMCLLAVLLISVKLSIHTTPHHIQNKLSWGIVFLPLWCLLFMFCVSPLVGFLHDRATFASLAAVGWVPCFTILVCLTAKLDGEYDHTKQAHIRLCLIFIPLWIIEGFIMLMSLGFLLGGYLQCRRNHYLEWPQRDEQLGMFALTWMLLSPPVIFQSMISAIDDSGTNHVNNHTKAIIPLLLLIGVFFIIMTIFALQYKYGYQDMHQRREQLILGSKKLFRV